MYNRCCGCYLHGRTVKALHSASFGIEGVRASNLHKVYFRDGSCNIPGLVDEIKSLRGRKGSIAREQLIQKFSRYKISSRAREIFGRWL